MYPYLINKEGYDHESLKAYKAFEGYHLFWDGHVLKLMKNKNLFSGCHYIKFGVKPTEREKTQVGQKPGWIIIPQMDQFTQRITLVQEGDFFAASVNIWPSLFMC